MTTLTDAELFCLRYLEREEAKRAVDVTYAAYSAGQSRPLTALGSLRDAGFIRAAPMFPSQVWIITSAGRAEIERREGEG